MLEIRFSENKQKEFETLSFHTLYVMNKEPLYVQGDKEIVSALFQAIQQTETISFWQDEKQIDTQMIKKRMLCIDDTITLSIHKRVGDYLRSWFTEEQLSAFLVSLPIHCDPQMKLKELSVYEQSVLQIRLELLKQPKLILLTYDASSLTQKQIQTMRELLMSYIECGCYILVSEQAKTLLPATSVDIAHLPTNYIQNYLEESIDFTSPSTKVIKKRCRISLDVRQLSQIFCTLLFVLGSFFFIYLSVCHFLNDL